MGEKYEACCNGSCTASHETCQCGNANSGVLTAAMEVAGVESIPGANVSMPSITVDPDEL